MGKEDKDKKKSHKSDSKEDSKKSHKSDKKSKHREEKERKHSKGDHERGKDDGDDRPKITVDDYFTKSEEFRVWLKLTKGSYFEDLTSKDARKIFEKDFVKDFNKGRLSAMFYDGNIPHDIRAATVKSQHKWGIKMSKQETEQLADLAEDVDMQTRAPTATTDATKVPFSRK
mmetsp:Transcript_16906/g.37559  ORF Transcript_16906/g.37559 Transcript_16906/m.37559 type:complete len:172 (-) Transcript_16906:3554-4069(-)